MTHLRKYRGFEPQETLIIYILLKIRFISEKIQPFAENLKCQQLSYSKQ